MGKRILIAAPVHQNEEIFKEYLNSLNHLIIPKDCEVKKFFYLHNSPKLKQFLQEEEYKELLDNSTYSLFLHEFKKDNYSALSYMRSSILEKARKENYDYVFSVDSDILLHPKTLQLALKDNKDIIGILNWSNNYLGTTGKIVPNCYDLEYWKWWEYDGLINKTLYERGIVMGAVLIGPRVLQNKNINYYPISQYDYFTWEDYAFSLKAHVNIPDLQVFLETRLPARHLYREKDYIRWIKEKQQYE